ncbi:conserved hypothetical protein [Magnetococcus marinus MC-1]|uniref:Uncharacterized protein n=1 Tax=Magnetococcus marinus (strain ATCC BAA-1437 / JCM 17883 / MC-1) TaxID=156889 RepID=A0L9D6_MAGMM|nr:hypothetical protein [Magnetococcus marinus]ABK44579.1 conserved hypothetical protein [Magnetococcus marinus MC-1]
MSITLNQLRSMPVGDIAALSARELTALQEKAGQQVEQAKLTKELIDTALNHKYADQVAQLRDASGKEFGTIRFDDGDVEINADLPKRAYWDQEKLATLVERIKNSGEDPHEYVDISFNVPERKFNAWPGQIRQAFVEARTIKPGKATFKLAVKHPREVRA